MTILPDSLKDEIKKDRKVFDADDVRSAWQKNTDLAHFQLLLDDDEYYGLPEDTWQKIMEDSDTKTYKYIPEFRDCDDFAFIFKGELAQSAINGCGIVFNSGGKHAYNVVIVNTDKGPSFKFIEPQLDKWIITGSKPYYAKQGPGFVLI